MLAFYGEINSCHILYSINFYSRNFWLTFFISYFVNF